MKAPWIFTHKCLLSTFCLLKRSQALEKKPSDFATLSQPSCAQVMKEEKIITVNLILLLHPCI